MKTLYARAGGLRLCMGLALGLVSACGGKTGTIALTIVVSPADDPFAQAASVRFTIGDSMHISTSPVSKGHFTFSYDEKPPNTTGAITVEALDAAGNVIAHGQSPILSLAVSDQEQSIAVWVGRPSTLSAAEAALPDGARSELTAVPIPGLGILYAGGRDSTEAASGTTAVYDVFTQAFITPDTTPMNTARAGAVGIGTTGVHAVIFGGAQAGGKAATGGALGTAELFDPTSGAGLWVAVPSDTSITPRSRANLIALFSGNGLVTGGADQNGMAVSDAAFIDTSGTAQVTALSGPMTAARLGHAVAPAHFISGDGALIFGGVADGSSAPLSERLIGQSFTQYDLPGLENRVGATATTLPTGVVLILGGKTVGAAGAAVASGAAIELNEPAGVTLLPSALSSPREGHTATLVGSDVLVCGGADANGNLVPSCDLIDGMTYGLKSTLPLAMPRRDHTAVALETGPVLITGGRGQDGGPLSDVQIYTP